MDHDQVWIDRLTHRHFRPIGTGSPDEQQNLKGQMFFRSLFYMPYIVPFVAAVFLWGGMLNPETGWINRFLLWVGVPRESLPLWANDINWVYPTYVIMGIWGIGNAMLIMLAGLQGVPTELYDAAKVDGANGWQTFWKVTFPMISPVIFYNLVLSMVGLFQYFLVPLVVNQGTGSPGGATYFYNLYLYKNIFHIPEYVLWLNSGLVPFCGDPAGHDHFVRHRKILGLLRCGKPLRSMDHG